MCEKMMDDSGYKLVYGDALYSALKELGKDIDHVEINLDYGQITGVSLRVDIEYEEGKDGYANAKIPQRKATKKDV